jgi:hypothetical protein
LSLTSFLAVFHLESILLGTGFRRDVWLAVRLAIPVTARNSLLYTELHFEVFAVVGVPDRGSNSEGHRAGEVTVL